MENQFVRNQLYRQRPLIMVREYVMIALALFPFALIVNWILVPHNVVAGGLTGICSMIYYATSGLFPAAFAMYGGAVPIWLSTLVINLVLIVIAGLTVGWQFCIRTTFGFLMLSFWYRVIPMRHDALINDPLVACIVGGVLFGFCLAVVMMNNGSSGGTDIIAMIVHRYHPNFSLGLVMVICDIVIILCSYFLPIPEHLMSGVTSVTDYKVQRIFCGLCMTVSYTMALDWLMARVNRSVQIMIISPRYAEIATAINQSVNRGVTVLAGMGWYSQQMVQVVLVLCRHDEAKDVLKLVYQLDENAFVSQSNVSAVLGAGFSK